MSLSMFLFKELFPSHLPNYFSKLPIVQQLAIVCICLLPIFHLTFNDWTGYWIVLSSFFSLVAISQNPKSIKEVFSDPRSKWILLGLIAYTLAIFMSQLCRWSFTHKAYLDTSPFLYFIPVFIFVVWRKINMGKWLQWVLPIIIIGAFWSTFYHHRELARPDWIQDRRFAPYFSDPLAFGQIILTLGLMSLSTINFSGWTLKENMMKLWGLLGFALGIYLSIRSGSRTGWLAIPIILIMIGCVKLNWSRAKTLLFSFFTTALIIVTIYVIFPSAQERIALAIHEIISYPWQGGIAPDASVGLRITFQRLGLFYFSESPLYGWGTGGYTAIKDAIEVQNYSTEYARNFVYSALFHNEIMTQMVRYGIFGIVGYILAVLVPLGLAFHSLKSKNGIVKRSALLCSIFLICQIVAGFSDEFINLKGMVAFYAFMITSLLGTCIAYSYNTKVAIQSNS
jgi:O-antigen ligase